MSLVLSVCLRASGGLVLSGTESAILNRESGNPAFVKASAPHRGQNPQTSGKEGFGAKKLLFPSAPEKGALRFSLGSPVEKWGSLGSPVEKWGLF